MNDNPEGEALRSLVSLLWITQQHFLGTGMLQARRIDQLNFFLFLSDKCELTAGSDEKKTQRSPAGDRTRVFRLPVGRSNH